MIGIIFVSILAAIAYTVPAWQPHDFLFWYPFPTMLATGLFWKHAGGSAMWRAVSGLADGVHAQRMAFIGFVVPLVAWIFTLSIFGWVSWLHALGSAFAYAMVIWIVWHYWPMHGRWTAALFIIPALLFFIAAVDGWYVVQGSPILLYVMDAVAAFVSSLIVVGVMEVIRSYAK